MSDLEKTLNRIEDKVDELREAQSQSNGRLLVHEEKIASLEKRADKSSHYPPPHAPKFSHYGGAAGAGIALAYLFEWLAKLAN